MNREVQLLLGIDVGTSGLKVVLLDASSAVVDEVSIPYGTATPRPGWAEQNPEDWWESLGTALRTLWSRGADSRAVAAIGLTGQMHSLVLANRDGTARCPSLLWSDGRTSAECQEISQRVGEERLIRLTGNRALAGFTAPKILWVGRHWPEALAGATYLFLPKDVIRFRMSGVAATDMSDASGTLLFDTGRRSWSRELAEELGVDAALLPPCFEGTEVVAQVSPEAAAALGLVSGTPIVAGGGDNAAAAVALGAVDPGILTLSIGTSGVVLAPLERYPAVPDGTIQVHCHAVPDRWMAMAVTLSAGGSLRWLRDVLAPLGPAEAVTYDRLTSLAGSVPAGSDGLVFLPYLTGERAPVLDPAARGLFFGLHAGHGLGHIVRAVLEGVAFSQRQCLEQMRQAGATARVLRGAGGGLSSSLWRQVMADVLGVDLQIADPGMGAASGAAILAGLGVGLLDRNGVDWHMRPLIHPNKADAPVLNRAFDKYVSLYPRLRSLFP